MDQFLQLFAVFSVLISAQADQFIVLHTPKSLEFKSSHEIPSYILPNIFASSVGYSVPVSSDDDGWDGFRVADPFNLPKSVVAIVVEGAGKLDIKKGKAFNVFGSDDPVTSFLEEVMERDGTVVSLDMKSDTVNNIETPLGVLQPAGVRKTHFLKPTHKEHQHFMAQISVLDGFTELVASKNGDLPTATVLKFSVNAIKTNDEEETVAHKEAMKILNNAIDDLSKALDKSYGDKVLTTVIATQQIAHNRLRRATPGANNDKSNNIAEPYDENYPVIFNIIFWFSVAMIFTLLAISMAIGYMDPGRDSIIYRMTSTRMKKDN